MRIDCLLLHAWLVAVVALTQSSDSFAHAEGRRENAAFGDDRRPATVRRAASRNNSGRNNGPAGTRSRSQIRRFSRQIDKEDIGRLERKLILRRNKERGEVYLEDGYTYSGLGADVAQRLRLQNADPNASAEGRGGARLAVSGGSSRSRESGRGRNKLQGQVLLNAPSDSESESDESGFPRNWPRPDRPRKGSTSAQAPEGSREFDDDSGRRPSAEFRAQVVRKSQGNPLRKPQRNRDAEEIDVSATRSQGRKPQQKRGGKQLQTFNRSRKETKDVRNVPKSRGASKSSRSGSKPRSNGRGGRALGLDEDYNDYGAASDEDADVRKSKERAGPSPPSPNESESEESAERQSDSEETDITSEGEDGEGSDEGGNGSIQGTPIRQRGSLRPKKEDSPEEDEDGANTDGADYDPISEEVPRNPRRDPLFGGTKGAARNKLRDSDSRQKSEELDATSPADDEEGTAEGQTASGSEATGDGADEDSTDEDAEGSSSRQTSGRTSKSSGQEDDETAEGPTSPASEGTGEGEDESDEEETPKEDRSRESRNNQNSIPKTTSPPEDYSEEDAEEDPTSPAAGPIDEEEAGNPTPDAREAVIPAKVKSSKSTKRREGGAGTRSPDEDVENLSHVILRLGKSDSDPAARAAAALLKASQRSKNAKLKRNNKIRRSKARAGRSSLLQSNSSSKKLRKKVKRHEPLQTSANGQADALATPGNVAQRPSRKRKNKLKKLKALRKIKTQESDSKRKRTKGKQRRRQLKTSKQQQNNERPKNTYISSTELRRRSSQKERLGSLGKSARKSQITELERISFPFAHHGDEQSGSEEENLTRGSQDSARNFYSFDDDGPEATAERPFQESSEKESEETTTVRPVETTILPAPVTHPGIFRFTAYPPQEFIRSTTYFPVYIPRTAPNANQDATREATEDGNRLTPAEGDALEFSSLDELAAETDDPSTKLRINPPPVHPHLVRRKKHAPSRTKDLSGVINPPQGVGRPVRSYVLSDLFRGRYT